jgi:hypothetical protein
MGGAGTSVPPVLLDVPPELLDEELLDDELEELELLLVVPKLDEELPDEPLLDELDEEPDEPDDPWP